MPWYVIVIIVMVGVGILGYVVTRIARLFDRAEGLIDDIKDAGIREETTPKSLNAMDSLLLPQILKDFPEYNRAVILDRVTRDAKLFYESAAAGELLYKDGISASLSDNVRLPEGIEGGISVHKIALAAYDRSGRDRLITYQAAVKYDGEDGRPHQTRLSLKYIAANSSDFAERIEVIKCPNCSAPVSTVGEKVCRYCGAALVSPAGAGWVLIDIREC
ncbi:MAG: hypothetical protein J5854_00895 [Clostridia bacterium]|nr:hypothetical protein [Clostridia bacterium]